MGEASHYVLVLQLLDDGMLEFIWNEETTIRIGSYCEDVCHIRSDCASIGFEGILECCPVLIACPVFLLVTNLLHCAGL